MWTAFISRTVNELNCNYSGNWETVIKLIRPRSNRVPQNPEPDTGNTFPTGGICSGITFLLYRRPAVTGVRQGKVRVPMPLRNTGEAWVQLEVTDQIQAPATLTPEKETWYSIGGWVCPGAGLDVLKDGTSLSTTGIWTLTRPACSLVAILTTPVFLNLRASARYRVLASLIPGLQRFSWKLSF